jgi:predicted RNA-binding protein associated with RNAse of E/G family
VGRRRLDLECFDVGVPNFVAGETIVVRDMMWRRTFIAYPQRVISDGGDELVVLLQPGTRGLVPTLYAKSIRDHDEQARAAIFPSIAGNDWTLEEWTWRWTTRLSFMYPDRFYSIRPTWDAYGELLYFYVNFEAPFRRTAIGVDTCDFEIDLVVQPDLSYEWKDEDEYAHCRRLGLIGDGLHTLIDDARQHVVGQIEAKLGPFGQSWDRWSPDPAWSLPSLPPDTLDIPCAPDVQGIPG